MNREDNDHLSCNYSELHNRHLKRLELMITTKALKRRADKGDSDSQFRLGYRIAFGRHRERPTRWTEALHWWLKAADQGHARAMFYIGVCYDNGWGVEVDTEEAINWFKRAATGGHGPSAYNVSVAYMLGEGVNRDTKAEVDWLRRGVELGDSASMRNLGVHYHEGHGVARDDEEAVRLYESAAALGDASAYYNLGLCWLYGNGVPSSKDWARYCFERASKLGHKMSKSYLRELQKGGKAGQDGQGGTVN